MPFFPTFEGRHHVDTGVGQRIAQLPRVLRRFRRTRRTVGPRHECSKSDVDRLRRVRRFGDEEVGDRDRRAEGRSSSPSNSRGIPLHRRDEDTEVAGFRLVGNNPLALMVIDGLLLIGTTAGFIPASHPYSRQARGEFWTHAYPPAACARLILREYSHSLQRLNHRMKPLLLFLALLVSVVGVS